MALVAVTDHPFPDLRIARGLLAAAGHTVVEHHCRTAEDVARACTEAEGLLNTYTPLPATTLRALPRCRAVSRFGIGVDTVDLAVATECGMVVTNVPDYCTGEVAAHAMALLLAVHRRIAALDRDVRSGGWDAFAAGKIRRLEGARLGLVGAGRIPRALAIRAQAFELRVAAYDPYLAEADWPATIERRSSLEVLAAESDFLSLHAPSVPETYHIVGEELLDQMPEHAVLINTARGALVDSVALVAALRERRIAGAGLDVVEQEPLAHQHELRGLENLVVTPHVAFYSEESLEELQRKAAEQLLAVLAGRRPIYLVSAPEGCVHAMTRPPATSSVTPVIHEAASEAR